MTKFRVLHRPDGIIELRRRRLRDRSIVRDVAILVGLCIGCVAFIALLATILVETPLLIAASAVLLVPVALSLLLTKHAGLEPAHAHQPVPRPPDGAA